MTVRTRQSYMDLCRSDRPWKGRDMADLVDKIYDVEEKADRASKVNTTKLVQAKADVAGEGFLQKREGKWILSEPDFLTEEEANKIYARIRHTHNEYALRRHAPTHHYGGSDPLEGQEIHGLRVVDRPTWAAVRLDPDAPTPPTRRTGDMYWDADNHCPSFVLEGSDTVWQGPMEDLLYGQNDSGVAHGNGLVGYISGSQGQRPTIDISRADDRIKSLAVVFATETEIANSNSGYYTSRGFVRDVNTNGMAQGARLWLQPTGGYGTGKPSVGANVRNVSLGHVVRSHATTGSLFADITPYPFIDELSGVSIVAPTTGQVLAFNGTIWENATIESGGAPIENHNDLSGRTVADCHNAMAITDFYALTPGQLTKRDGSGMVAAIPNTDYLAVNNPTYTGRLTGPTQYLEANEQILLAIRRPGGQSGRIHGASFMAQDSASAWVEFGRVMTYISSVTAGAHTGGMRLMAYKDGAILQALEAGPDGVRVGANLPLQMGTTTIVDASRNGTLKSLTVDENIFLPNSVVWKSGATNYFSMYATSIEFGIRDLNDAGSVIAYPLIVKRGVGGEVQIGYSGGLRPVRIGGALKNDNLAGSGTRPVVALADGTFDDQDAATFRGTIGAAPTSHAHPYLPIENPTFAGTLTGPTIRAEANWSAINGQAIVGKIGQAGYYSMRRGSDGSQTGGIGWMASATESNEFRHSAGGGGSYQTFVNNGVERLRIATDGALLQSMVTFLDANRNITGTTVKGLNAAGIGIRPAVALADGTFDDQDAATFLSTISAAAAVHDHTSITGSAAKLTTARSIGMTGDGTWSVSFDGSANVSGAMTLASIITAGGPVGSATKAPQFTWDSKGRLTAVDEVTITPAWSSITSKPTTFSGLGVTMLASDIPNHASRHHWDGADPLDGQSIAGLRTTSSPTFLDVTAGQFYATSNGLGQNYRVGDDLWIGDIDLANTCRIAGVQNPAIAYIKFGSAGGPTLGFSGTTFTLSSGIALNGDLSFYNGAAVAYPGSGIGLRPASGIVRLVVDDTLVTANTAFLATSGQFSNLVSGFVKSSSSGQLINGSILATDLPNHASRHEYGGADSLAGQSIAGLRTVDSPEFLNLLLDGELRFTGYNVTSYDGAGFYVQTSGSDQLLKMTVADGAIVGFGCHPDVQGRELGRAGQRWNVRSNDLNHDLETLTATNTTPGSSILAIPSTGNGFILVNGASGSTRNYRVPNALGSGIMKRIVLFSASIDPTGFTRIYPPSSGQLWNGGTQVTTYLEFGSSAGELKIVMDSDGSNWYI